MIALRLAALLVCASILFPHPAAAQQRLPAFDQGRLYVTAAQFQRAIDPYQAAIRADARNARAHYWLGFAYLFGYRQFRVGVAAYAADFVPRALASLREAVRLDAGFVPATLALHDALILAGEHEEADALLRGLFQRIRPAALPYTLP